MKSRETEEDWFKLARYGYDKKPYRIMCARAHESTGDQCTLCGRKSVYLHHAQYWAWWRWLADVWLLLRLRDINLPEWQPMGIEQKQVKLGALTQGREVIGWSAFPVCERCHPCGDPVPRHYRNKRGIVHASVHWRDCSGRRKDVAVWHSGNRFWMLWALRIMWRMRKRDV